MPPQAPVPGLPHIESSHSKAALILICMLVAIIAGTIGFVVWTNKSVSIQKIDEMVQASSTPSYTIDTSTWKTYRSTTYGFEITYPPEYISSSTPFGSGEEFLFMDGTSTVIVKLYVNMHVIHDDPNIVVTDQRVKTAGDRDMVEEQIRSGGSQGTRLFGVMKGVLYDLNVSDADGSNAATTSAIADSFAARESLLDLRKAGVNIQTPAFGFSEQWKSLATTSEVLEMNKDVASIKMPGGETCDFNGILIPSDPKKYALYKLYDQRDPAFMASLYDIMRQSSYGTYDPKTGQIVRKETSTEPPAYFPEECPEGSFENYGGRSEFIASPSGKYEITIDAQKGGEYALGVRSAEAFGPFVMYYSPSIKTGYKAKIVWDGAEGSCKTDEPNCEPVMTAPPMKIDFNGDGVYDFDMNPALSDF